MIRVERDGGAARLTVDRPPLNILDIETTRRLGDELKSLADDATLHAIVVTGAGERAFSAGAAVEDHVPERAGEMLTSFHSAIRTLRAAGAVTIAAVRGHCLGGGFELAAACDLIVAAESARFGQPEIELGCYPPVAAALLPRRLGAGRALELLVTGRTVDASEAERLGLIARRVPDDDLDTAVGELVAAIGARSRPVVRLLKRAVRAGAERHFDAALAETERIYVEQLLELADAREGIDAFMEKRRPEWKHA